MPPIPTFTRLLAGVTMLMLGASCVPHRDRYKLVVAVPPASGAPVGGHRLLRLLALDDPLGRSAPSPAAPVANTPANTPPNPPAPPFLLNGAADDTAQRAAQCLTAAVYYEARSEPLDGQRAVAQVVLNRVRDRAFPDSVCKVVYQRPANRPGCQFSFACDGSTDRPIERRAWDVAGAIAHAALAGSVYAPVGSATYYHTNAVQPWWSGSLTRIGLVGSHIFYRWGDALGRALSFRQAYSGDEALPQRPGTAPASIDTVAFAPARDGGAEVEAGVTVHRASALAPTPALASAKAVRGLMRTSFGVTVHYTRASDPAGPAAQTADNSGGTSAS